MRTVVVYCGPSIWGGIFVVEKGQADTRWTINNKWTQIKMSDPNNDYWKNYITWRSTRLLYESVYKENLSLTSVMELIM